MNTTPTHEQPATLAGPWLASWLHAESASSYAHLGHADLARSELVAAPDEWDPPDENERADMDWLTSLVERNLGRLDTAERFAASAIRTWDADPDRRRVAMASITFAELHLRAREPDGLRLAHEATQMVAALRSQRARDRLEPLVAALESRPGTDYQELARMARQVSASRAA